MFNSWSLNSAGLNSGSSGVRVLFASAVLASSASAECTPIRTTHATANVFDGLTVQDNPRADAQRAARSVGYTTTYFEVDRPLDLILSTEVMTSHCTASVEPVVYRMGTTDIVGTAEISAWALRFDLFATMEISATMPKVEARVFRFGSAEFSVISDWEVDKHKEYRGNIVGKISATAEFRAQVIARGLVNFDSNNSLFAEGHLNGIQPGWATKIVNATLDVEGEKHALGYVDAEVFGDFEATPLPGRGVAPTTMYSSATLDASCWVYVNETAEFKTQTTIDNKPTRTHAGRVDATAGVSILAAWSRIVEPQESIVLATATLDAEAHRIRPGSVDSSVYSWMEPDGRLAIQADAIGDVTAKIETTDIRFGIQAQSVMDTVAAIEEDGRLLLHAKAQMIIGADLEATPWRHINSEANLDGFSHLTRSRASVNILNPAPEWRRMIVPYENRTMVVR